MPNTITGSSNIAVLDSKIIADLCLGKFFIDLSPSVYIGSGAGNVLGAKVKITNPYGVVVKDFASSYEIAPSLPDTMNTVVQFNVPLQSSNYQYGKYVIEVKLIDTDSKEYSIVKTVDVKCIPNAKAKKYGTISAQLKGSCKDGKVYVLVDTPPVYSGKLAESQVASYSLEYPTGSGKDAESSSTGNFSAQIFEGVFKITGETCVTYNLGDNVFVNIKYKLSYSKEIRCGLNQCAIYPRLVTLREQLDGNCSAEEKMNVTEIILESLNLMKLIDLGIDCGEDVSDYVTLLSNLLNISEEDITTVTINTNPATDFLIEGCNVLKETIGLTDKYTINNYEYVVDVTENGGVVTASEATLDGCTKTQKITFNINAAYTQIKNIITNNSSESTFWSSIVNNAFTAGGVNWTLLGLTPSQVTNMTLEQKFNYLLNYVKSCCECIAAITAHEANKVGNDVEISWDGENLFGVEVYVDTQLVATILQPSTSFTVLGLADNQSHDYTLIPKNSNGKLCTPVAGTFEFFGCAAINPPSVSTNNANGVECPYDLTQLVAELPLGVTAEWHTANNTNANSLVGDPEAVSAGVYWVFAKDTNGCYSTGVAVTVVCAVEASCTSPQNLMVVPTVGGFMVQFQSATNPPPIYRVKRKLKADPDVDGSYTIIGNPSWNASTNRWEIMDTTAVNNVLYTYVAESMCANDARPSVEYNFANLICPTVTLTPSQTGIAYSFVNAGGGVDRYEIYLYNSTGLVLLDGDNIVPAFTTPIEGEFTGLTQNTEFKVKLKMFIGGHGGFSKDCGFINTATAPEDVCPEITGINGEGFGGDND